MRRAINHPSLVPSTPAVVNLRKIQHTQVFKDGNQAESECVLYVASFPGLSSEVETAEFFKSHLRNGNYESVSIEAHHSLNGSTDQVVASIRASFKTESEAKLAAKYIGCLRLNSIHKDKFIKVGTCACRFKENLIVENIGLFFCYFFVVVGLPLFLFYYISADCAIPSILRNGKWDSCTSSPEQPVVLWTTLFIDAVETCTMSYLRLTDSRNRKIFPLNVSDIVTVCKCFHFVCSCSKIISQITKKSIFPSSLLCVRMCACVCMCACGCAGEWVGVYVPVIIVAVVENT